MSEHIEDTDRRGPDFEERPRTAELPKKVDWPSGFVAPPFVPASTSNYTVGRGGDKVVGVVIHTVVGTVASAEGAFKNPARGASAHFIVGYNGSVVQMVDTDNTAWHCGRYFPDAAHPLANLTTVGIEHEDMGNFNSPRPDALYAASARMVATLSRMYGFPVDSAHIRPHRAVSESATSCPDSLDVTRIIREAYAILHPAPQPPPDTRPEWLRNLTKLAAPASMVLAKSVNVYSLNPPKIISSVPAGPLTVAYQTSVGAQPYWVTAYGSTRGNGLLKSDVEAALAPTPTPGPSPVPPIPPTPSPVPTPVPVNPPAPVPPQPPADALDWLRQLFAWLKDLFHL